jgi:hypothetical protein
MQQNDSYGQSCKCVKKTRKQKMKMFYFAVRPTKMINQYLTNACMQIISFPKKSDSCYFETLSFEMKQCQYQIQTILFVMSNIAVCQGMI